MIMIFDLQLG